MAIQFNESSGAKRRLYGKHLDNLPQLKSIDYSVWWPKRVFSVRYLETNPQGLTLLL